jgi:hypothetical protein
MEENIDNFYNDFKFANTVDEKIKLLESFISGNDISDDDLKELQLQINDVIEQNAIEEDLIISMEIEDGKYKLHTCVNEYFTYKKGVNYYIKIDDPKEFYRNTGIGETNTLIKNMIDSIKPIYYIVVDDGIGTLKRKNILSKDIEFSKYFTKFA